jgi:hypothetical protein
VLRGYAHKLRFRHGLSLRWRLQRRHAHSSRLGNGHRERGRQRRGHSRVASAARRSAQIATAARAFAHGAIPAGACAQAATAVWVVAGLRHGHLRTSGPAVRAFTRVTTATAGIRARSGLRHGHFAHIRTGGAGHSHG